MFKIAVCDDEKIQCSELESFIIETGKNNNMKFDIDVFFTGESLQDSLDTERYDIIFLDIELITTTGIEIGHNIRDAKEDNNTQIIYVSSKEEYARALFKTRPLDFLVKPIKYEDMEEVLVTAVKLLRNANTCFEFSENRKIVRILVSDILYFETEGRKMHVVTAAAKHTFYGKKSDVMRQVSTNDFVMIHNAYLVNYNHVVVYGNNSVELSNGETLPVSQKCAPDVRRWLLNRKGRIQHGR